MNFHDFILIIFARDVIVIHAVALIDQSKTVLFGLLNLLVQQGLLDQTGLRAQRGLLGLLARLELEVLPATFRPTGTTGATGITGAIGKCRATGATGITGATGDIGGSDLRA
ncbi:hypothetical protein LSPH24S_09861 [Lysinibacillus sphaericus]